VATIFAGPSAVRNPLVLGVWLAVLLRIAPEKMSKVLRTWNPSLTVAKASGWGVAVWEKTVARTNREGGVKSPGRPRRPLPWP